MKKTNQAVITGLSHEGRGIAHVDGKTVFVQGALPDETVIYQIIKSHRRFDEGLALEITHPNSARVSPQCDHFQQCGGCSLQHINPSTQILQKQSILLEQLDHFAGTQPQTLLEPLTANAYAYRRKARLGLRYVPKKEKTLIGFREMINPRLITDIKRCEILHPAIGRKLEALSDVINSLETKAQIPQIEVAVTNTECALIIRHLSPLSETDQNYLRQFSDEHHIILFLQPDGIASITRFHPINGSDYLTYTLPNFDLTFQFHPSDFTQVNQEMNEKMVALALSHLAIDKNDHCLDLFCGLGNFSLPMAKFAAKVTGVEGSDTAVKRAIHNATLNQLTNAAFFADDLSVFPESAAWTKTKYNKILLDPPRTGALEIAKNIGRFGAEIIVYISCNPATLARDCGEIIKQEYCLTHAGVMDMFPQTAHVESIAVFQRCT